MGITKASDWFATELEFRQLCGDAQSQARGESSQDFAAEMVMTAKREGLNTPLSPKQLAWLCKLADWDVPGRVSNQSSEKPLGRIRGG